MGNMHCISDRRYPFRLDWNSRRISGRLHRYAIKLSNRREGTRAFRGRHIQVRITDQIPPRLRLGWLTPRRFRGYKRLRLYRATGAVKSHVSGISVTTLLEDFSYGSTRVPDCRVRVGVGAQPQMSIGRLSSNDRFGLSCGPSICSCSEHDEVPKSSLLG
jgi:hypothetical protein